MEDVKKEVNEERPEKLSYEQLENATQFMAHKAEALSKENEDLKKIISDNTSNRVYTEISLLLKVLDHKEFFSEEFISKCVAIIEKIMSPKEEDKEDGTEE